MVKPTAKGGKKRGRKYVPIERIFREIVGRKMSPQERRVLLPDPGKGSKRS